MSDCGAADGLPIMTAPGIEPDFYTFSENNSFEARDEAWECLKGAGATFGRFTVVDDGLWGEGWRSRPDVQAEWTVRVDKRQLSQTKQVWHKIDLKAAPSDNLERLLAAARNHVMTDEELEAQRQSWARGQLAMGSDRDEARERQLLRDASSVEDTGDVSERQPEPKMQTIDASTLSQPCFVDASDWLVTTGIDEGEFPVVPTVEIVKIKGCWITTTAQNHQVIMTGAGMSGQVPDVIPIAEGGGPAKNMTIGEIWGAAARHAPEFVRDRMVAAAMAWNRDHSHLPRQELFGEARMRELVEAMLEAAGDGDA